MIDERTQIGLPPNDQARLDKVYAILNRPRPKPHTPTVTVTVKVAAA